MLKLQNYKMASTPLKSDVIVDASKFDRSTIDKQTLEFNKKLIKIWADGPRWYEVIFSGGFFSASLFVSQYQSALDLSPRVSKKIIYCLLGKHAFPKMIYYTTLR